MIDRPWVPNASGHHGSSVMETMGFSMQDRVTVCTYALVFAITLILGLKKYL